MLNLYPVLILLGNDWKDFLDLNNTLIADEFSKRGLADVKIDREIPSFAKVYDVKDDLYVLIDEAKLPETLESFSENGIVLSEEPVRMFESLFDASYFLGYQPV